jgi:hypothetical protein
MELRRLNRRRAVQDLIQRVVEQQCIRFGDYQAEHLIPGATHR